MKLPKLLILAGVALTQTACNNDTTTQHDSDSLANKTSTVTSNTDLTQLQSNTSIPGQPLRAWWANKVMGTSGSDSVPGPTDTSLDAIIDYGSQEAVELLLKSKQSSRAVRLVGASWYPESFSTSATDKEGRIPAKQYRKVPGFHPNALIQVPESHPSFIILNLVSG